MSILGQTFYHKVDIFYINIDDNLTDEDYIEYNKIATIDDKIKINIAEAKWRSANKLLPVYRLHHNDVIVCFDDDKMYPSDCLKQLCDKWIDNQDCIIAQEINPAIYDGNQIFYVNQIDVKLGQREFGKYLSNACLFCPNCFPDEIYNFDNFMYITNGMHDELWFWIMSTINGVQCIGLDNTFSYGSDDGVTFDHDESALTHVNADIRNINGYNQRLNEKYGKDLLNNIANKPIEFCLNPIGIMVFVGHLKWIISLYGRYTVHIRLADNIALSWKKFLQSAINSSQPYWTDIKIIS